VVYLACSVEQQYARTRHSKHRPLLQTADPVARLRDLFQEREPLYRAAAHLVVNTEHRSVKSVVKELTRILQSDKTPHDAGPARQEE
jgi:shikimate kinase